jgi:hypothetical protein
MIAAAPEPSKTHVLLTVFVPHIAMDAVVYKTCNSVFCSCLYACGLHSSSAPHILQAETAATCCRGA